MITIPTGELTGIIADVLPFAHTDEELPAINAVRVEWDGQQLHALATDRVRIAISSWHPDDDPDEAVQEELFGRWGGADARWAASLPRADAKDLVDAYKLPAKEQRVPLTIGLVVGQVRVVRTRDTGYSAITMAIRSDSEAVAGFPDVRKLLAANDTVEPVRGLAYTAKLLADFAKVRPRGPLELAFTGKHRATLVTIGSRFTGAIVPVRKESDQRPD